MKEGKLKLITELGAILWAQLHLNDGRVIKLTALQALEALDINLTGDIGHEIHVDTMVETPNGEDEYVHVEITTEEVQRGTASVQNPADVGQGEDINDG